MKFNGRWVTGYGIGIGLLCLAAMASGCGKKGPPEPLMKVRQKEQQKQLKPDKPQTEPVNSTVGS